MKSYAASYSLWQENGPPKPPRGRNRDPVACPLQDTTSTMNRAETPKHKSVFRAKDARDQLIHDFGERIGYLSSSNKFCGRDGLDVMKQLVQQKNPQWADEQLEEKSIMMLDHWLKESVIKPLDEDDDDEEHIYVQNRKVFYSLNPSDKHRVLMITPRVQQAGRSASRERGVRKASSCSRKGSFKRLFGLGGSDEIGDENLPANISPTSTEDENPSRCQSPRVESRRLSIGRIFANAFNYSKESMNTEDDQRQLTDDALLFEMALKRLLLVIDVSFVDDIISLKNAEGEGVISYLSTILRKIGLKSDCEHSDEATMLLNKHIIRSRLPVLSWFKAAVECNPHMHINTNVSKCVGERDMLHFLAKQALSGVVDHLNSFTDCSQHPLIPLEFEALLSSIASQLFRKHSNPQTRNEAIVFLWLMIPKKMRSLLDRLLRLLDASKSTDNYFSLSDSYFWKSTKSFENSFICRSSIKKFIFPQSALSSDVQEQFLELLIELKGVSVLDQIPQNIRQDIEERKLGREKAPVQYCQDDSKGKTQVDINEIHIVNMIGQIKTCKKFNESKKKDMINTAKKQYPDIFRKHFPNL